MRTLACLLLVIGTAWSQTAAVNCACDHAVPATLEARECSLCVEADKQPRDEAPFQIFFLKDASPRKPNRTLAVPIRHDKGQQDMRQLTPEQRAIFWKAAIAKAQQLWPDAWGLAINSETVRTQCHLHIHIGKLNEGVEESGGVTVATPEQFPLTESGRGIWLHPVAGGFHVHTDREIAEPMLVR
jgi:CDP-diacylglycerol pyrophosphatase